MDKFFLGMNRLNNDGSIGFTKKAPEIFSNIFLTKKNMNLYNTRPCKNMIRNI